MKKLIIGIGIATFSTFLSAQRAFDGFNLQLGLGVTQNQISSSGTEDISFTPFPNINSKTTGSSFNGIASVGYSQSFDNLFDGFNLAGNIFYILGNQSSGGISRYTEGEGGFWLLRETLGGNYKFKNTWGISLEPGYYFTKEMLGYFKLAYVSSSLSSNFSCSNYSLAGGVSECLTPGGGRGATSSFTTNNTINGIGYGIGAKYQITKDIYGALDFLYVDYSKINQTITWTLNTTTASFKPQQTMGFLSIGYKF